MTSDPYKLPNSIASLNVLPSSGKIDQLRAEPPITPQPRTESKPTTVERKLLEGKIIAAISKVYDPEIPVNVYELGLIYDIDIADDNSVTIKMTLTAPGCPVAGSLPLEVEKQVEFIDEVKEAEVILVWEPAWDKSRMSEAALLQLGF